MLKAYKCCGSILSIKMRNRIPFILLVVVILSLIYSGISEISFANVDDKWMLLDEKLMLVDNFDWTFLKSVFTQINSLQYSPLNTLYYYFIYQLNGFDPYYFHLGSLLVHTLNTVFIFIVCRKILVLFEITNSKTIAYAIALVWSILPFNVESVVWISASKILLYTFFGLLSFNFYIEAYLKKSSYLYFASLVCFLLSFLAKEQAVMLPLMYAIFSYCYTKKHKIEPKRSVIIRYLLPFFILSFLCGIITLYTVIYGGGTHPVERYPFSHRIILMFYCLCFYLFNNFIPFNLHYHYPFPVSSKTMLPFIYYLYPLLFLLILWFSYQIVKSKQNFYLYLFAFGIFIVHLLLCIQLVPLARAAMMADRYMYFSSLGLLIIAGVVLNEKLDLSFKRVDKASVLISLVYILYVLFLASSSYYLVENWKTMQL